MPDAQILVHEFGPFHREHDAQNIAVDRAGLQLALELRSYPVRDPYFSVVSASAGSICEIA